MLFSLFLSLEAFDILSLFSVLVALILICHRRVYFGQLCLVSWRLPVTKWAKLSQVLENFLYYFIECIMYSFGFHLFSFFNAHDFQVWSFDGVTVFLHIPFTALEFFD
jgi:hypothetical protein